MPISALKKTGFVCLLSIFMFTACATEPAALGSVANSQYTYEVDAKTVRNLKGIRIVSMLDDREKDAILTDLGNRPMDGTDVMEWLRNSLEFRGATFADAIGESFSSVSCYVDLKLKRAHVTAKHGTSKTATVVLGVRSNDTDNDYAYLRGNSSTMNWNFSSRETNAELTRALDEVSRKLSEFCSGEI